MSLRFGSDGQYGGDRVAVVVGRGFTEDITDCAHLPYEVSGCEDLEDRFPSDKAGYAAMRSYVKSWPDRVWAVDDANGAGRPLQPLVEAGEQVVDVPAKLAARARALDTGHNRKTDALDAHSIAMVAVNTPGLRVVTPDGELEALRMLTDRRDELARLRVQP